MNSAETLLHRSQKWLKSSPSDDSIIDSIQKLKTTLKSRPVATLTDCQSTIALLEAELKSRNQTQSPQQDDPQPLMTRAKQWIKTNPSNKEIIQSIRALKRTLSSRPKETQQDARNTITLLNDELEQREINKIQKRIQKAKEAKEKALNQAADQASIDSSENEEDTKPKSQSKPTTTELLSPAKDPNLNNLPDPSVKELHGSEKHDAFAKLKAQFGK